MGDNAGPAWGDLRPEILQQIFSRCSYGRSPPGTLVPPLVCRSWRAAAQGCRDLHVVFSYGAWKPDKWSSFLAWLRRYAYCLSTLEVRLRPDHDEPERTAELLAALQAAAEAGPPRNTGGSSPGGRGGSSSGSSTVQLAARNSLHTPAETDSNILPTSPATAPAASAAVGKPHLPHLRHWYVGMGGPCWLPLRFSVQLLQLAPALNSIDLRAGGPGESYDDQVSQLTPVLSQHSQLARVNLDTEAQYMPSQLDITELLKVLPSSVKWLRIADYSGAAQVDVACLQHLTSLHELHLAGVTMVNSSALQALTSLTEVALKRAKHSLEQLRPLIPKVLAADAGCCKPADVQQLTALTSFDAVSYDPAWQQQPVYSQLQQLKQLHLDLDQGAASCATLSQCRQLTGLTSLGGSVNAWDPEVCCALSALTQLRELTLEDPVVDVAVDPMVNAIAQLHGLQRLTIQEELLQFAYTWLHQLTRLSWLGVIVSETAGYEEDIWNYPSGSGAHSNDWEDGEEEGVWDYPSGSGDHSNDWEEGEEGEEGEEEEEEAAAGHSDGSGSHNSEGQEGGEQEEEAAGGNSGSSSAREQNSICGSTGKGQDATGGDPDVSGGSGGASSSGDASQIATSATEPDGAVVLTHATVDHIRAALNAAGSSPVDGVTEQLQRLDAAGSSGNVTGRSVASSAAASQRSTSEAAVQSSLRELEIKYWGLRVLGDDMPALEASLQKLRAQLPQLLVRVDGFDV